jgi:hypothetical protein
MNMIRYVTPKRQPPALSSYDKEMVVLALQSARLPAFGQAPAHPSTIPGRIGIEYSDKYRGDKK